MTGRARTRQRPDKQESSHTCGCGKQAYETKQKAKRALRERFPAERMRVYECSRSIESLPAWHFGHLRVGVGSQ